MEQPEHGVPGWGSFPTYVSICLECGEELEFKASSDQLEGVTCIRCNSSNLKVKYVSYPTDGPGFQEGYNPSGLIYGGAAASSEPGTDIAGLPLCNNSCSDACSRSCAG